MPQTCMLLDRASGDLAGDEVSDWMPPVALMLPPCAVGLPRCVIEQLLKQRGPGLRLRPPPPVVLMPFRPVEDARQLFGAVAEVLFAPGRQLFGAVAEAVLAPTLLFVNSRLANEGLLERIRCCNFSKERSSSPPSSFGGLTTGVTFECRSDGGAGATTELRVPMGGVDPQVVVSVIVDVFKTADDNARANASPATLASPRSELLVLRCLGRQGVVGDQARWRGG